MKTRQQTCQAQETDAGKAIAEAENAANEARRNFVDFGVKQIRQLSDAYDYIEKQKTTRPIQQKESSAARMRGRRGSEWKLQDSPFAL